MVPPSDEANGGRKGKDVNLVPLMGLPQLKLARTSPPRAGGGKAQCKAERHGGV